MALYSRFSTTGYLLCSTAPVTAAPLTIAGWHIGLANGTGNAVILDLHNSGSAQNRDQISLEVANYLVTVRASSPTGTTADQGVTTAASNRWNHYAVSIASATQRDLYLNGVSEGTGITSRVPSGINRMGMGTRVGSTNSGITNCPIAHVGLWNVALTATEIAKLASGALPSDVRPDALIGWWPLDLSTQGVEKNYVSDRYNFLQASNGNFSINNYLEGPLKGYKKPFKFIKLAGAAATATTITPNVGALNFTGVASTLNLTMTPAVGALTLGGLQPTVSQGTILTPSVGTLTLSGTTSTMNFGMTPTQGTLTFNGYAPTVSVSGAVNITPAVGSLTINGLAPTMNLGLTTGVGSLTISGLQPSISLNTDRTPAAAALTFGGLQPTLSTNYVIAPTQADLSFTGYQPTLTTSSSQITVPVGTLALTGYAPIIVNTTPVVSSVQPTGGWRIRKPGEYYFGEVRLPTPEEVQTQREKLGILPRTMRKAIDRIVERELSSAASDEESTKAIFDQYKSGELRQRLRSDVPREAGVRPTRSSKGLAPILEIIILDGLRQRAFADQQNALIQAMMAEEDEIKHVLSLWLQL